MKSQQVCSAFQDTMVEMVHNIRVTGVVWRTASMLTISMLLTVAAAHQIPDFISIDCGGSAQYKDFATNLTWDNDERYILTGVDGEVAYPPHSLTDNYQALRTFKYFPERRNKYCYEIPVRRNISILIRAMFLHGNSSQLKLHISFDVYVDATLWSSVHYEIGDSSVNSPKVLEGIFLSPGSITYLCLVPNQGFPFISSLELRHLDSEGIMYSSIDREKLFLSTLCRYRSGAPDDMRTVRYPDDAYDRLWTTPGPEGVIFSDFQISSRKVYPNTTSVWNNVPPAAMMTAWTITDAGTGYGDWLPLNMTKPSGYLYAILYSEGLNETAAYIDMTITLNDAETKPFNVSNIPVANVFSHFITATNNMSVGMFSTSNAILNAFEIYEEIIFDDVLTSYSYDEESIIYLKKILNFTDWQGGPCLPVPYDWITCRPYQFDTGSQVDTMTLSRLNNTANLRNMLKSPDPEHQYSLTFLSELSITNSYMDDATFHILLLNLTANLYQLNLAFNRISTIPEESSSWPSNFDALPYYMDLSHNLLTGEVPTFSHSMSIYVPIQYLNLSYNSIASFSSFWGNSTTGLLNLITLDVSHNSISSDISSNSIMELLRRNSITSFSSFWGNSTTGLLNLITLDVSHNSISSDISSNSIMELLRRNSWLKELHVSDNFLFGTFPGDFYFSRRNVPNLTVLNLDRNNLTGVLNLSTWLQHLRQAFETSNPSLADRLYSFVGNNIVGVTPQVDDFEPIFRSLMITNFTQFNQSGVLLGGNPFCNNAKSFMEKYLCRSSVTTSILEDHDKKKSLKIVLISGIIFILLCFIVFTFIIWRLWLRLSSASKLLTEIQQELTNRRVQPPFYPYPDLKVATKNFHENNKLGSGAFGAVYKGIFPDGTIIAVKRLFNSEKETVLNDFLNEVVLITGIKHRNLVQLKGCCIKDKERILVYEFATNGNLAEALWGQTLSRKLLWVERVKIVIGIARGLSYLHEELQPRIIHRDIKAANVLLDETLAPKIADFGFAKLFEDEQTQAQFTAVAGTRGYFAPEYVMEGQLTTKADVYSFGILLLEIATGKKCIDFTQSSNRVYLKNWVEDLQKEGSLSELLSPDLRPACLDQEFTRIIDIALLCTRVSPQLRPSMSQVVAMLSENMVVSTSERIDNSHEENIGFNPVGTLKRDSRSGSPPEFHISEEIPLMSNPSLADIRSDYSEPFQRDWLSPLRSRFTGSERVRFGKSRSFPNISHREQ